MFIEYFGKLYRVYAFKAENLAGSIDYENCSQEFVKEDMFLIYDNGWQWVYLKDCKPIEK
jgi:hypothetical protein